MNDVPAGAFLLNWNPWSYSGKSAGCRPRWEVSCCRPGIPGVAPTVRQQDTPHLGLSLCRLFPVLHHCYIPFQDFLH